MGEADRAVSSASFLAADGERESLRWAWPVTRRSSNKRLTHRSRRMDGWLGPFPSDSWQSTKQRVGLSGTRQAMLGLQGERVDLTNDSERGVVIRENVELAHHSI